MKKICFLIFYSLLSFSIFSREAMISSFNILRLGEAKKNYRLTALVIKEFDVVGILEVMNREGIEKLVDTLNKVTDDEWDYHMSPYAVGSKKYKEHYGYVWKKNKVSFLKSSGFYKEKNNEFFREPYAADFKIDNFDFTFVLFHIIYGKSESDRRKEVFHLKDVYNYFQDLDPNEQDIIMAGDFNLTSMDEAFDGLYQHPDKIIRALNPLIKTTVGKNNLVNSYDHFFLSKKHTREFTGKGGALNFAEGNYTLMRKIISDHIPVFIIVNTEEDDD